MKFLEGGFQESKQNNLADIIQMYSLVFGHRMPYGIYQQLNVFFENRFFPLSARMLLAAGLFKNVGPFVTTTH